MAGGAGFLGSNLCDALLARGDEVIAVDNLCTVSSANLEHASNQRGFTFVDHDVCEKVPIDGAVDGVMNLASPASPPTIWRRWPAGGAGPTSPSGSRSAS